MDKGILIRLDRMNMLKKKELELKEKELKQIEFFTELIEEVLPLDDGIKRGIHQRIMRRIDYDY